ncbi:hypothetical protein [Paracidovorax sp. MALMAid1276]|uniref:hypothetical protein n=1 Tax=Paracidovorax sp. MALMAid1276 TaxID=3411631 RepID=UPI003B994787
MELEITEEVFERLQTDAARRTAKKTMVKRGEPPQSPDTTRATAQRRTKMRLATHEPTETQLAL